MGEISERDQRILNRRKQEEEVLEIVLKQLQVFPGADYTRSGTVILGPANCEIRLRHKNRHFHTSTQPAPIVGLQLTSEGVPEDLFEKLTRNYTFHKSREKGTWSFNAARLHEVATERATAIVESKRRVKQRKETREDSKQKALASIIETGVPHETWEAWGREGQPLHHPKSAPDAKVDWRVEPYALAEDTAVLELKATVQPDKVGPLLSELLELLEGHEAFKP